VFSFSLFPEGAFIIPKNNKIKRNKKVNKERKEHEHTEQRKVTGKFLAHPKGFGFVELEDPDADDIFIPEKETNGAFHLDVVDVTIRREARGGQRCEGSVTKILEHGITKVVGLYRQSSEHFGFVEVDDNHFASDVFIGEGKSLEAMDGDKVVVELLSYGGKDDKPEGQVIEILGQADAPGVDILSVVREFDLPEEFNNKIIRQAKRADKPVADADIEGRLDLRELPIVTIDGEDALDLDDGVSLYESEKGYELGVHIADVSNYVKEGSLLDKEALKRGTSVYLADRVIPMLPRELSNGICSLNQGEDRLALSCLMTINKEGELIDHQIRETVIRVARRMNYNQVSRIIENNDSEYCREFADFAPMFHKMKELSELLRKRRGARGSIDFDFPETKITLDENGEAVDIRPYERNAATKLIEDFMLLANETVAEDFFWQSIPFLYRSHEVPDMEKIKELNLSIQYYGYSLKTGQDKIHPKEIQKLLSEIEGKPEEAVISRLTLRSMKRARYTTDCIGHFGLAAKYYCHFTSPIRRYPDLQIHRIIKETINGQMNEERRSHYEKILGQVAENTSSLERRSDDAERAVDKLKEAEYMKRGIGKRFTGVISGITDWGIYVELPNTIEGMVHVSTIKGDYYEYHEETHEMVGEHTGRKYRLGQQVKIRVTGADKILRTIDFELCED